MKYRSVIATRLGPPEVLQVVEHDLRAPTPGEVRVRVLAASVSRPDVSNRTGETLYTGTPLAKNKPPFVPGYAIIGDVEALGEGVENVALGDRVGVLTIVGGYTEVLYWSSDALIPVPTSVDPVDAATLILNYIVAYQVLHRVAKVEAGDIALILGASGGIGTALLQLGQLAGLKLYGLASWRKHGILTQYGATPIDYHTQDFVEVLRQAEPGGIDVVLDGMSRVNSIRGGLSVLRRGGCVVSFGDPGGFPALFRMLWLFATTNLLPNGKSYKLYGTSPYFLGDKRPFLEDWATLFKLLADGQIDPVISETLPIIEAAQAHRLLEGGSVTGNVVLVAPGLA